MQDSYATIFPNVKLIRVFQKLFGKLASDMCDSNNITFLMLSFTIYQISLR